MRLRTHECGYSTKQQKSHFFGEYKTYKTTTLAMPRLKRKGTIAKIVDSAIHKDPDRLSSIDNASHKNSTLMEQMKPLKKGRMIIHKIKQKIYPTHHKPPNQMVLRKMASREINVMKLTPKVEISTEMNYKNHVRI